MGGLDLIQPLDGPSSQTTLTVNSSTVQELKVGVTSLEDRKVITFRADQRVKIYFGDDTGSAPSSGTVSSDGLLIYKNQLVSLEASASQSVYILAVATTADVQVVERA